MKLSDTLDLKITVGEAIRIYALLGKSNGHDRHRAGEQSLFSRLRNILDPDGQAYNATWGAVPSTQMSNYYSHQLQLEDAILHKHALREELDKKIQETQQLLDTLQAQRACL